MVVALVLFEGAKNGTEKIVKLIHLSGNKIAKKLLIFAAATSVVYFWEISMETNWKFAMNNILFISLLVSITRIAKIQCLRDVLILWIINSLVWAYLYYINP